MNSDEGVRRQALIPSHSYIVQAPAGSGKTELLTQRYLRLLADVDQPEQILAITFTRKAAAEMRNRILLAIDAAAQPAPAQKHKQVTWSLAAAVREKDARCGWQLTEHPSRLRIQTIDALNATLARRLPMLAGTGSALEPAEEARPLYEAAVARLIERLGDGTDESAHLQALIVHLGNRVDRLESLMCDLLAKRDQWLHPIMSARQHDRLREMLEQTLSGVIERHLQELCAGLLAPLREEVWSLTCHAASNLLATADLPPPRRELLEAALRHGSTPDADGRCLPAWLAVAQIFLRKEGGLYKSVSVRQGFPPQDKVMKQRMSALLAHLAEDSRLCAQLDALRDLPSASYSSAQWRILEALLAVLPMAVAELQLVFRAHGQADYIENALRALQALGTNDEPTDLALAFDYRLQHLLIDEFQDTSFAQLDLLERLTAGWSQGDGRSLFCVGDPMQSIYRFRQAEVGLFLQLQRRGLSTVQLHPLKLTSNFRSRRPIIDWVNEVFPSVLSPRDDPEQGAVRYSPSIAAGGSPAAGSSVPTAGVFVHAALDEDAAQEARRVVAILQALQRRDPQGSVAILATARTHVGRIAVELSAAGIDFQAVEIERLGERPVVQDLIALTRALVHPADRSAWLAVLRAPWCGLALDDLHALAGADRNRTITALLDERMAKASGGHAIDSAGEQTGDHRIDHLMDQAFGPADDLQAGEPQRTPAAALSAQGQARLARVYPVLCAALRERGRAPLRDWVESTWNSLGGPAGLDRAQDLDDAQSFFERLTQIEVAADLADVARLEDHLQRLFARPRAETRARVEIMTIHKAKGLEFDAVILPGLHRPPRGDDHKLLRWTRVPGHGGIVFAPLKAEGSDPDPVYRWVELLERERTALERARLLYVAATRARRELHLLGSVQTKQDEAGGSEPGRSETDRRLIEPHNAAMLRLLWPAVRPAFEALAQAPTEGELPLEAGNLLHLRRLPLSWQAPAADASVPLRAQPVADIDSSTLEFDWVTETARHVGTLVHRELERLVQVAGRHADPSAAARALPRLAIELAELGVPPQRCEPAARRVAAAIELTLSDERGRWLLGLEEGIEEAASEFALSGLVNGRVVSSVIDRCFVDRHGVRWIVDFKTSAHEGGQLAEFLDSESRRYRPQLQHYAQLTRRLYPQQPVRAALYFPLLRQWVEVALD